MSGPYDDIIGLHRPVSRKHPPLSAADRAAQFSPFAALTGYADILAETGRLTERRMELSDEEKERLDSRLRMALARFAESPVVAITYFQPDGKKSGGAYQTVSGVVRQIDALARSVRLSDGTQIPLDEISAVEGDLFESWKPFDQEEL